jgi:hypothetical protein
MKTPPNDPEFARFTDAMRTIVNVSKVEMNRRMEAEKKRKANPSASRVPDVSASVSSHQD